MIGGIRRMVGDWWDMQGWLLMGEAGCLGDWLDKEGGRLLVIQCTAILYFRTSTFLWNMGLKIFICGHY